MPELLKLLSKTNIAINCPGWVIIGQHVNEYKCINQMSCYMYHKTSEFELV